MLSFLNRSSGRNGKRMLCLLAHKQTNNLSTHHTANESIPNKELLQNLKEFASENIIEAQEKVVTYRARYKTLTVSDLNGEDMNMVNDTFLTRNDFMLGKLMPVDLAQTLIDQLHDYMPYYAAIIVVPFLAKLFITIPITIWQQKSQQKILPSIPLAMKEYRTAADQCRKDKTKMNAVSDAIREKYGFNPMYAQFRPLLVGLAQAPIHMTFYISIRTMYSSYPDWRAGGAHWFTNLANQDPYWILPFTVGGCMGLSFWNAKRLQKNNAMMMGGGAIPEQWMNFGFAALSLIMVPFAHHWSCGFNIYMASNIMSYVLQMSLLQNDSFRSVFGLRPSSYQIHYQKELREINANANAELKDEAYNDTKFVPIYDKHQRRRKKR